MALKKTIFYLAPAPCHAKAGFLSASFKALDLAKISSLIDLITSPNRFVVSQNQKALHIVFPHQFLDSPEYFGVSTDDYFQVSITAIDEAKVLIWHRDKLKLSIINDEFLQIVFDHILGRDVVKKLMQVSQVSALRVARLKA